MNFLKIHLFFFALLPAASTPAFVSEAVAAPRPELVLQIGHAAEISDAALSPSGQSIATSGQDATLKLWNAQTGELKRSFENEWGALAFSPDNSTLLVSGYQTLRARDAASGRLRHEWKIGGGVFSPDAKRLAVPKNEVRGASVEVWSTQNGTRQTTLAAGAPKYLSKPAWSRDGDLLAAGDYEGKVYCWRVKDGALLKTIDFRPREIAERSPDKGGNTFYLSSLAFSPDGKLLATAGSDGAVRVAEIKSGRITRKLGDARGYEQTNALLFTRDGSTLLAAPGGNPVRRWNLQTGRLSGHLKGTSSAQTLSYSRDGSTLLVAGYMPPLGLWDAKSLAPKKLFPLAVSWRTSLQSFRVSPDARFLAATPYHGGSALWDWKTLTRFALPAGGEFVSGATPLLVSSRENVLEWRRVPNGALWKKITLPVSPKVRAWEHEVRALAVSADGKMLAAHTSRALLLIAARTGQIIRKLPGRVEPIRTATFSPDGKFFAAGGGEEQGWSDERGTVTLWNLKSQAAPRVLAAHNGVQSLAWSTDGSTLAVGCGNEEGDDAWGEVQLWDAASGKLRRYLTGHAQPVVALSWQGSTLLAASRADLKSWRLPLDLRADGEIKPQWTQNTGALHLGQIPSGDARTFLCARHDGTLEVRRVQDGALRATLLSLPSREARRTAPFLESWILFTPDHFYTGSKNCEQWIRWRVGDQLFPAAKFKARFHRPAQVRRALGVAR